MEIKTETKQLESPNRLAIKWRKLMLNWIKGDEILSTAKKTNIHMKKWVLEVVTNCLNYFDTFGGAEKLLYTDEFDTTQCAQAISTTLKAGKCKSSHFRKIR